MDNKPEQVETVASVNGFCMVVMIGLAFTSGYLFSQSVVFSPAGLMTVASIKLVGAIISLVLLVVAFSLNGRLVKVSRKRI